MAEHKRKILHDWNLSSILFRKRKKKLEFCRELWEGKVVRERDFDRISLYHQFESEISSKGVIDNRTWRDLDMNSLFSLLDTTASKPGQQFLFHWLKQLKHQDEETISQKHQDYKRISEQDQTRVKIQLLLGGTEQ
jgi:hypothetical protein